MNIRFIGQGYDKGSGSSVAQVLIEALANNSFHTFKCLVAFASHTGVSGLREHIENSKQHIHTYRVIVGVDQNGTSKEALESILEWEVNAFVYYTSQRIIFHPKIYLFEGDNLSKMRIEKTFGETIKGLRKSRNLTLKDVSSQLDIDISTLGKIEKNQRSASKNLITRISHFFGVDEKPLQINFLSDKIAYQLEDEKYASEVLRVAEAKVKYLKHKDSNEAH